MSKVLVAFFSVGGTTAKAAKDLAAVEGADLFEIRPETPYVPADLDYTSKQSRTTLEMTDLSCRPAMVGEVEDMAQYDVVFVGFPIWWGREPSVVDTFLEAYSFSGKKLVPFCTSGASMRAKKLLSISISRVAVGAVIPLKSTLNLSNLPILFCTRR